MTAGTPGPGTNAEQDTACSLQGTVPGESKSAGWEGVTSCSLSSDDHGSKQAIHTEVVAGKVPRSRETPTAVTKLPELMDSDAGTEGGGCTEARLYPHSAPTMALEQWDPHSMRRTQDRKPGGDSV